VFAAVAGSVRDLSSSLFRDEPSRIDDDDVVPFGTYHARGAQLAERADDDLADRPDRLGQLLLVDWSDQFRRALGRKVEQMLGHPWRTVAKTLPGTSWRKLIARSLWSRRKARVTRMSCAAARRATPGDSASNSASTSACTAAGIANPGVNSDITPSRAPGRQYRTVIVRPSVACLHPLWHEPSSERCQRILRFGAWAGRSSPGSARGTEGCTDEEPRKAAGLTGRAGASG
jgi:hypothetical protein